MTVRVLLVILLVFVSPAARFEMWASTHTKSAGPATGRRAAVPNSSTLVIGPPKSLESESELEGAPPEETFSAPWTGQLFASGDGRALVDERGVPVLPVIAHFGEAFAAYVRRPREVEVQLLAMKQAGYDGIRFWDNLGYYTAWRGREVTPFGFYAEDNEWVPRTLGYYSRLREFVTLLKRYGLVAHHSRGDLNTVSLNQLMEHSRTVRAIYDEVGLETLALYEGNNEDWQNGNLRPDGLRLVVEPFRAAGVLTALSHHSEEPDDVRDYATDSLFYVHGFRRGEPTDRIRHVFSVSYERHADVPRLGWQGEPIGPGSSVGTTSDPEELGLLAAISLLSRQAWTYMSGHGVFWDGPLDGQPGFHTVPRVRAFIGEHAPDVMTFHRLVHGGRQDAVLVSPDDYFDPDLGIDEGPARIDQAIAEDGRVVAVVHGGQGRRRVQNRSSRTYRLYIARPDSEGLQVRSTVLLSNQITELEDYRVGRILVAVPQ